MKASTSFLAFQFRGGVSLHTLRLKILRRRSNALWRWKKYYEKQFAEACFATILNQGCFDALEAHQRIRNSAACDLCERLACSIYEKLLKHKSEWPLPPDTQLYCAVGCLDAKLFMILPENIIHARFDKTNIDVFVFAFYPQLPAVRGDDLPKPTVIPRNLQACARWNRNRSPATIIGYQFMRGDHLFLKSDIEDSGGQFAFPGGSENQNFLYWNWELQPLEPSINAPGVDASIFLKIIFFKMQFFKIKKKLNRIKYNHWLPSCMQLYCVYHFRAHM